MSRSHDGHWPFLPFGNPLRMIFPKGSYLSPKLLALSNSFEETLAERLKKLNPKDNSDIISLSWMRYAMESLSETHTDIKTLITDLQFPISDWDEQWMDMYLDNSVKLLDICIAFSSEISRLDQAQLLLQYVLHVLGPSDSSDFPSAEQLKRARASLHDWMQQINSSGPKLEESYSILQRFAGSLFLAKVKKSAKGKVLMRAMYGVKFQTIFVCSVFAAALSGSSKLLMDVQVSDQFLWSESFNDLQATVNGEIRRLLLSGRTTALKELEEVKHCAEKLDALIGGGGREEVVEFKKNDGIDHKEAETLQTPNGVPNGEMVTLRSVVLDLGESAEKIAVGLDLLTKQVGEFFQIVLSGRDALLCNLRVSDVMQENHV